MEAIVCDRCGKTAPRRRDQYRELVERGEWAIGRVWHLCVACYGETFPQDKTPAVLSLTRIEGGAVPE